jgi:hypothetical protein
MNKNKSNAARLVASPAKTLAPCEAAIFGTTQPLFCFF